MLWIDPDGLRANGAEFHDLGDQAQETFEQLRAALAQEGRCWGDDAPGKAFEQNYLPDAERGLDALQQLATALQDFGQQLNAAADSFETQDQLGARHIDNAANSADSTGPAGRILEVPPTDTERLINETPTVFLPHAIDPAPGRTGLSERTAPTGTSPQPVTGATGPIAERSQQPRARTPSEAGTDPQFTDPTVTTPVSPGSVTKPREAGSRSTPAPTRMFAPNTAPSVWAPQADSGRNIKTTTPWQPGARPPVSATWDRRPPNTPWSNTPYSSPPLWPRPGFGASDTDRRKNGRRRPGVVAPRTTPWMLDKGRPAHPLLQVLVDRHDLATAGFDAPGIDDSLVQEFAAAVDIVLTNYPVLTLSHVVLDRLARDEVVRARRQRTNAARPPFTWSIVLNVDMAQGPGHVTGFAGRALYSGSTVPGATERPVYTATLHELGTALDISGNRLARRAAQRGLIAEYLRGNHDYRHTSLGTVVRGYKRWRDQLCGQSFTNGCFDPPKALAWAFTDVVLNGARATEPAAVLHRLLVDAARAVAAVPRDAGPAAQPLGSRS
ncbi:WXG100 family type VII secretion target [Nocardia brasiliensis]|uniref:WXG100 family type VII secretion target n=1 Tax=Nocardia brasiliensis TaxID=37326 RepID=UPI002456FDD3|nr:hypothetical protein [Nocardia brasiliensis]